MDDVSSEVSYSQPWSQGTTDHDALGSGKWVAATEMFSIVVIQSISYRVHRLYVSLSSCFHMTSFSAESCDVAWIMHSLRIVRRDRSYRARGRPRETNGRPPVESIRISELTYSTRAATTATHILHNDIALAWNWLFQLFLAQPR